jgi:hypothetical protein
LGYVPKSGLGRYIEEFIASHTNDRFDSDTCSSVDSFVVFRKCKHSHEVPMGLIGFDPSLDWEHLANRNA